MLTPRRRTYGKDFDGALELRIRFPFLIQRTSSKPDYGAQRSKGLAQPATADVPHGFEAQPGAVPVRKNRKRSERDGMAFSRFVVILAILAGPALPLAQGASGRSLTQDPAPASAQSDHSKPQTASASSGAATQG